MIKLCPIPSSSRALVSSRHGLAGSPGYSAAAHRHQVSVGIFYQAGWSLVCSPLELWVLHHPTLGCADSALLRHPAFPLVHQLFAVRTLDTFLWCFMYLYLLVQIIWSEAPWNIQDFKYFFSSLMRGLGRHIWGETSSSSCTGWGKETKVSSFDS